MSAASPSAETLLRSSGAAPVATDRRYVLSTVKTIVKRLVGYSWIRMGVPTPAHCQKNRDVDKRMLTQPKLIGAPKLSCHQA